MEIVTGSTGSAHVTPIDDAVRNSNLGELDGKVVFTYLENLSARAITANEVRVFSGYGMNQGRLFKIEKNDYDSLTIENGSQGFKRADLIVARYTMNQQTGFEDISLVVIKGSSGSSYVDPSYNTGDINGGDILDDFPLYRVKINGLAIDAVEPMFELLPAGGVVGEILDRLDGQMRVNLASESENKLDGTEHVKLGVEGILPISHGGTGANSVTAAAKNIVIDAMATDTGAMTDSTEVITSESANGFSATLKKRTATNIWEYIQGKVKSLLGMGSNNVIDVSKGGTGQSTLSGLRNSLGLGNDVTQPLPIANGGTGATTAADALANLGVPSNVADQMAKATYTDSNDLIKPSKGGTGQTSLQAARNAMGLGNTTGALPVANGGTGQTSLQAARNAMGLGNTTGALPVANGGTGTSDGTLNGVKLGTSNGKYGYYAGSTFKAFKDPTGTASAGDVLSGKTFANASSDNLVTGSMPNRGAVSQSLNCGGSYTIPAGYHNGSGKVTANSLASQTSANASAGTIRSGYTAWVNGSKITGNIPYKGTYADLPSNGQCVNVNNSYYAINHIPEGIYSSEGTDWGPEIRIPYSRRGETALYTEGYNEGRAQGHADESTGYAIYTSAHYLSGQACRIYTYLAPMSSGGDLNQATYIYTVFDWSSASARVWDGHGVLGSYNGVARPD